MSQEWLFACEKVPPLPLLQTQQRFTNFTQKSINKPRLYLNHLNQTQHVCHPFEIPRTQVLAPLLPAPFFPLPPFFPRCAFAYEPQTYPAALILRHYHGLRFSDLVFVGYTADGYKKGLCHETPTAEELAGVC